MNSRKLILPLLIVISLLIYTVNQTPFLSQPTLKPYGKLTWNDFQKPANDLSQYDAYVSTSIELVFVDSLKKYQAIAFQNNFESWVKEKTKSDWLLEHEQGHFDIAHEFAQKMNLYIDSFPEMGISELENQLKMIKNNEKFAQEKYDEKTEHGRINH